MTTNERNALSAALQALATASAALAVLADDGDDDTDDALDAPQTPPPAPRNDPLHEQLLVGLWLARQAAQDWASDHVCRYDNPRIDSCCALCLMSPDVGKMIDAIDLLVSLLEGEVFDLAGLEERFERVPDAVRQALGHPASPDDLAAAVEPVAVLTCTP